MTSTRGPTVQELQSIRIRLVKRSVAIRKRLTALSDEKDQLMVELLKNNDRIPAIDESVATLEAERLQDQA